MSTKVIDIQEIEVPTITANARAEKLGALEKILRELKSVVVAYSGGVDSTFVLKIANQVLGENVIAVTAHSASFPAEDLENAKAIASQIRVRHVILETHEVEDSRYLENTLLRCYFCKTEMYAVLNAFALENNLQSIVDGLNLDDLNDRRPGRQAALERGVRSPLAEVHLTKTEIRALSKELGLPTWDKPAMACLSSRIPYGNPITPAALSQIDAAESFLRGLGIRQVRVRHHNAIARLEVDPGDFGRVVEHHAEIVAKFRALGYVFVALDLDGYRTGSLHALVSKR